MKPTLVVDASVAVKWLIPEPDSDRARALRGRFRLIAPQLIYAECANIIWKKSRRGDISAEEAGRIAALIDDLDIEVASMRRLVTIATAFSTTLDHSAYDCIYLALAAAEGCPFVTADERLIQKLAREPGGVRFPPCVLLSHLT